MSETGKALLHFLRSPEGLETLQEIIEEQD
jgi:hypothetical protein